MVRNQLTDESSMREFCDLSVPIIMFDKDDNFAVMTLEEVGGLSGLSNIWPGPLIICSYSPPPLAPRRWEPRTRRSSRRDSRRSLFVRMLCGQGEVRYGARS